MNVTGSTIQQLDKSKPKSRCREWRLWATTEQGRKSKRFHGTYTQASDALSAFVAALEDKVPNSETFGAYAESWAAWRAQSGRLKQSTISQDAQMVRGLRRTQLDDAALESVTAESCRDALLWLKSHAASGGEYTNTTMMKYHQALGAIMQQAEDDGKVARNPMARVKPPRPDTVEKVALSPDELGLLLNRLDAMPLDGRVMAVYLIACLGLRRGEACALAPDDVSNGFVSVSKSVMDVNGSIVSPKTTAGGRVLPASQRLIEKVAEWREKRRKAGWEDSPTLCCGMSGGVMRPRNLGFWWKSVRDGLGCEGMVLHELRHSNLSMMARHMSMFDLQRWAGWSSIEPARIYIHDDMESLTRAAHDAWACIERTKNAPNAGVLN